MHHLSVHFQSKHKENIIKIITQATFVFYKTKRIILDRENAPDASLTTTAQEVFEEKWPEAINLFLTIYK